jgi:hypothetical protein
MKIKRSIRYALLLSFLGAACNFIERDVSLAPALSTKLFVDFEMHYINC